MKILMPLCLLLFAVSCGGSLSEEQRRQMREKMEENKIVRVTEVEITEAAFAAGRRAIAALNSLKSDSAAITEFAEAYPGSIRYLGVQEETGRLLEKQLLEAYRADTSGSFQDNVQNVRDEHGEVDSILYTQPHTRTLTGGATELLGVWNIWLAKKDLVKEIARGRKGG